MRFFYRRAVLALVAVFLVVPGMAFAVDSSHYRSGPRIDAEEDCLEPVPASYSFPGVSDDGHEVVLAVHVLLDGVAQPTAEAAMSKVAETYAPLSIKVVARYQGVSFQPEELVGTDQVPTSTPERLFAQSKEAVGGVRPADSDVVYLLTTKDIEGASGVADCIGGVRWPDAAFAIGEISEELPIGPVRFYVDGTSEVAAHEIGHLMGAHHHYANCVEGAGPEDVSNVEPAPCTLMFNYTDFMSPRFGTLEGAVVRGHALAFADA